MSSARRTRTGPLKLARSLQSCWRHEQARYFICRARQFGSGRGAPWRSALRPHPKRRDRPLFIERQASPRFRCRQRDRLRNPQHQPNRPLKQRRPHGPGRRRRPRGAIRNWLAPTRTATRAASRSNGRRSSRARSRRTSRRSSSRKSSSSGRSKPSSGLQDSANFPARRVRCTGLRTTVPPTAGRGW